MITSRFVAGALLRRGVRSFLVEQQMKGRVAAWHEDRGWLDSTFVVSASEGVWRSLIAWGKSLDEVAP